MSINRFKPKFNIRKGDNVVVIAGDDKDLNKPRKVLQIFLEKAKVLVEGVNIATMHKKPNAQNTQGGIIKKELPIHISNVMLWDATISKPTKIVRKREGKKILRISKKSGEII